MDKHNHHTHDSGGFSNGFLLGVIVGAALVFFLFTKRGKQMLKVISEEGLEGLEEFKDIVNMDLDDDIDEPSARSNEYAQENPADTEVKRVKRFFRNIRKN